jgi:hypothetical protein
LITAPSGGAGAGLSAMLLIRVNARRSSGKSSFNPRLACPEEHGRRAEFAIGIVLDDQKRYATA